MFLSVLRKYILPDVHKVFTCLSTHLSSQPRMRQLAFLTKRTGCFDYGSVFFFFNQKKHNNGFKMILHLHGYSLFYL